MVSVYFSVCLSLEARIQANAVFSKNKQFEGTAYSYWQPMGSH